MLPGQSLLSTPEASAELKHSSLSTMFDNLNSPYSGLHTQFWTGNSTWNMKVRVHLCLMCKALRLNQVSYWEYGFLKNLTSPSALFQTVAYLKSLTHCFYQKTFNSTSLNVIDDNWYPHCFLGRIIIQSLSPLLSCPEGIKKALIELFKEWTLDLNNFLLISWLFLGRSLIWYFFLK